jgi:hypothetical protein
MTLTIIKNDNWVKVDGVAIDDIDCSSLASNVHAIQFDGSNGHIEYNDGKLNEAITSVSAYSTITDAHATKKASNEADSTANDTAYAEHKASYVWKRANDSTTKYAEITDQLDQLYKDMVADKLDTTGTWATGIKAVKDAHPK